MKFVPRSSLVHRYLRVAALSGFYPGSETRVLDFGCGAGATVYAFRDVGIEALGYDLHDYLEPRSEADRRLFHVGSSAEIPSDHTIDSETFELPYPDGHFDLIVSSQVFEHVMDLEPVMRELARVSQPVSLGIHLFPPLAAPLEVHTKVPLGGFFSKSLLYNQAWARLGVRNGLQKGQDWREVARLNTRYAETGTCYRTVQEVLDVSRRHYTFADVAPDLYELHSRRGPIYMKIKALRDLYTTTRNVVLRVSKENALD